MNLQCHRSSSMVVVRHHDHFPLPACQQPPPPLIGILSRHARPLDKHLFLLQPFRQKRQHALLHDHSFVPIHLRIRPEQRHDHVGYNGFQGFVAIGGGKALLSVGAFGSGGTGRGAGEHGGEPFGAAEVVVGSVGHRHCCFCIISTATIATATIIIIIVIVVAQFGSTARIAMTTPSVLAAFRVLSAGTGLVAILEGVHPGGAAVHFFFLGGCKQQQCRCCGKQC